MKKYILSLILLIAFATLGFGQRVYISNDTLYTKPGYPIWVGGKVRIGDPTYAGKFRFIKMNDSQFTTTPVNSPRLPGQMPARIPMPEPAVTMDGSQTGRLYTVLKVGMRGPNGLPYILIANEDKFRYIVNINNALEFGEIYLPEAYR